MKTFSKKQNENGFSIVEVIVATAIITIGIIPIIMLFNQNLKNEIRNKNILIASYLASESIEIVRQERDDNWTAGVTDWMGVGGPNPIPTNGSHAIVNFADSDDIKDGWTIETPIAESRKKVYLSDDGYYFQSNGVLPADYEETPFERYLTIKKGAGVCLLSIAPADPMDCVEITSHISFGGTPIAEVTAYLYDGWK